MTDEAIFPPPWGPVRLEKGSTAEWKIGECIIHLRRLPLGWAHQFERLLPDTQPDDHTSEPPVTHPGLQLHSEADIPASGNPDAQISLESFDNYTATVTGPVGSVEIKPALPDRPLVVRPQAPIILLPGKRISVYLDLPLWAVLYGGGRQNEILAEYPAVELSDTWFGDPDNGELAYSYDGTISSEMYPEIPPYRAVCSVHILNRSTSPLNFQRLCIRAVHLSLFNAGAFFITNDITLLFKGMDQVSQVSYGKSAPLRDQDVRKIAEPRIPATQNILRRSFYFLRSLTT